MKVSSILTLCFLVIISFATEDNYSQTRNDASTVKKTKDAEKDTCQCEEKCSEYVSGVNVTVGCFLTFVFIVFIIMLIVKRDKKVVVEELTIEQIDRSLEERRRHNEELQKRLYRQRLQLLQKL